MELEHAKELALELMKQHGLKFWYFEFDNSKRRFGICRHYRRTIGLSRNLVLLNTKESVKDTILHEIAHALAGPNNGHNWIWRQIALEIGCNGKRCYSKEDTILVEGTLLAKCPNCGKEYGRFRKPRKKYSCGVCSNGIYNEKFLLVFERKNTNSE